MTATSRESALIIDFASTWCIYGGGDAEDIMVRFGLTEKQFFERTLRILSVFPKTLDPTLRETIRSTALKRIQLQYKPPQQGETKRE